MAGALRPSGHERNNPAAPDGTEEKIKYVDRAQNLLDQKIKEGVSINALPTAENLQL